MPWGYMKFALFLTLSRLIILPFFVCLYLFYPKMGLSTEAAGYLLIFFLALSELSDAFDGHVARRSGGVTELGKILDPMSDSIVRISIFLAFTQGVVKLPLLLVLLFVARDAIISTLRTLCALKGIALAARASGKIKAIVQAIAIFCIVGLMIIYGHGFLSLHTFRTICRWIVVPVVVYTLFSAIEYVWTYRRFIFESWKSGQAKRS